MKRTFEIVTDSSCDLPASLAEEMELLVLPLSVLMEGKEYKNYLDEREIKFKDYYAMLREGKPATTSAANTDSFEKCFEQLCKEGKDILYLGFSSGLSGTYNAARIAAENIRERFPERKVYAVDTLCASMGQGLLIYLTVQEAEKGITIEEARDFVEKNKLHLCHWFTVDDLYHLRRGGRVTAVAAAIGTVLNIKPVLHVDNDGHLIPMEKVRGRKVALRRLTDRMEASAIDLKNQVIALSHGDCLEEAQDMAQRMKDEYGVKDVLIGTVGPVIGTHSGPGTMALFFLGERR